MGVRRLLADLLAVVATMRRASIAARCPALVYGIVVARRCRTYPLSATGAVPRRQESGGRPGRLAADGLRCRTPGGGWDRAVAEPGVAYGRDHRGPGPRPDDGQSWLPARARS